MINAIIVDDEKASVDILNQLLKEITGINVVGCFESSLDAKNYVDSNCVDIAFLDIDMPVMNGFELANHIIFGSGNNNKCAIVFVTAFNIYAVDAFELNALDYLLKPVSKARLNMTIKKIPKKLDCIPFQPEIKVKCFDRFRIMVGDTEVKFRTNKAQELIAFLIHRQGKSISRSEIIDNLWGDFDGDKAIINFNTTLCYVKKALLQLNIDLPIIYERGSYRLGLKNIDCDYFKFMAFDLSKEITNENIGYYEQIAALYVGDYLMANDYSWAEKSKIMIKDKYLRLLLLMAEYYSKHNDNSKKIEIMESGFLATPLDREITYTLIGGLLGTGNYSLAVSYYKAHRDALHKELNREPDDLLKRLMGFTTIT